MKIKELLGIELDDTRSMNNRGYMHHFGKSYDIDYKAAISLWKCGEILIRV